jgi:hypothetical protein
MDNIKNSPKSSDFMLITFFGTVRCWFLDKAVAHRFCPSTIKVLCFASNMAHDETFAEFWEVV